MAKRAIIVHGWGGSPEEGWFLWLERELTVRGFEVTVPSMPDPDRPRIAPWVQTLSDAIATPDDQLFLIGHSIGCQTILRYLQSAPSPIGGAVLVAPWLTLGMLGSEKNWKIAEPWLDTPIDDAAVRRVMPRSAAIFSSNDIFVSLENTKWFADRFGCKTTILGDLGHMSGDDHVTSLPIVLDTLLDWAVDNSVREGH